MSVEKQFMDILQSRIAAHEIAKSTYLSSDKGLYLSLVIAELKFLETLYADIIREAPVIKYLFPPEDSSDD